MSRTDGSTRVTELRRALSQADNAAYLVEARVIRRVIRERHGFAQLASSLPHVESQVVPGADLRHLVHPDELGLTSFSGLPETCILICEPDEGEMEHWPLQELLLKVWRRLFHAQVDRELLVRLHSTLHRADVQQRIDALGQVEFDEAHFVLRSEQRLVHPESRIEAWREFVAFYLELRYFEPDLLPVWFPSLTGRTQTDTLLAEDVDASAMLERSRLYGATPPDLMPHMARDETQLAEARRNWSLGLGVTPSDRAYVWQLRRRERAIERGNTVAAIVCAMRAVQRATSDDKRQAAREKSQADVRQFVERLRRAISFPEEDTDDWVSSLQELATNAVHGFWNTEKRLLFDLQKVCLDHERIRFKVDVVKWAASRGERPLRRPLNSLREVMMARHLASCAARLVYVRLSGVERERLTRLLKEAAELAREQMRHRMRPVLRQTFHAVNLSPRSVPEQVAFDKLTEDSLDCISDRGYLTMGYLRDQISKNDLKLPDLKEVRELWQGDNLLRADDQLDVALDGVYRRGEFYLRWLQITSSLFFGTRAGRFATLFLLIPFGGATVIVEGVRHTMHLFHRKPPTKVPAEDDFGDGSSAENSGNISDNGDFRINVETGSSDDSESAGVSIVEQDADSSGSPFQPDVQRVDAIGSIGIVEISLSKTIADESLRIAVEGPIERQESPPAFSFLPSPVTAANEIPLREVSFPQSGDEASEPDAEVAGTADDAEDAVPGVVDDIGDEREVIAVPPEDAREALDQIVQSRVETISWVLTLGFLLMALIHIRPFRAWFFRQMRGALKLSRQILIELPLKIVRMPLVQQIWRNRTFVRFRRLMLTPMLLSLIGCQVIPWAVRGTALSLWWVVSITALLSMALNSRLGRDAQELTYEWVGNAWYKLRARVVMAVIDWVIDFFRMLLNFLERFLYAVDEWLRFHSDESWMTIVVKAVLGVVWSFFSFVIRIYVNLLIEPTFHPVKHFPVVTVAHKMILPGLIYLEGSMVGVLSPYLGVALARSVTWFNIFFIPGIFGFAVWELKENWRLYLANRNEQLKPVPVGSHGETVARLIRPGFHSGTLPKLFRRLRRLENQEPSFRRFTARRAVREQLDHVETAICHFVQRELIRLLQLVPAWNSTDIRCGPIHTSSNSFCVQLECPNIGETPVQLLFQEQSGWVVASISETGWLRFASADQIRSFQHAVCGFYRKSGTDLVREQLENRFIHGHPYDINSGGLSIWPNRMFSQELQADLNARGLIRPIPSGEAAAAGIGTVSRDEVIFSDSATLWSEWDALWKPLSDAADGTPAGCRQNPRISLLPAIR